MKNNKKSQDTIVYEGFESSTLKKMEYSPKLKKLQVWFHKGKHTYIYHDVPKDIVEAIDVAESKGTEFAKLVKGVYEFTKYEI